MTDEAYIREFRHMAVKYGETLAAFDKAFKVTCLMLENGLPDAMSLAIQRKAIVDTGLTASNALRDMISKQETCLMREGLDARKKYQAWFAKCFDWLKEVEQAISKFYKTSRLFYSDNMWTFRNAVNGALEAEVILQELLEKELLKKKGGADGVDRA
jgi:hypothetical protein